MTASLAYRKNEAAILRGDVPEKYTRILPYITGQRVIEAGSAEGVLACLLAKGGKTVTAIDPNADRHGAAVALAERWGVSGIVFVRGHIQPYLLSIATGQFDTFVAVRMIYYLRDQIDDVFATIAARIPNVVLCGNRNRAQAWHAGRPHAPLGEFNYYASAQGMRDVLTRHGYQIVNEVIEGDAIVVGSRG